VNDLLGGLVQVGVMRKNVVKYFMILFM